MCYLLHNISLLQSKSYCCLVSTRNSLTPIARLNSYSFFLLTRKINHGLRLQFRPDCSEKPFDLFCSPVVSSLLGGSRRLVEMAASRLQIEGDESVLLRITHSNLKTFSPEIRFSLQSTVESVKDKLWRKCGTSVNSMSLHLYDDTNTKLADLIDSTKPLGFYSPLDGFRLHIVDLDPSSMTSGGWLEDTTLVEKYTISEEAYSKRDGTFRKFREKVASHNPSAFVPKITENYMEDLCSNIKVGDRCEVDPGEKRGVVKFVGRAESLAPGFWVGVQYDEPLGKHDGTVKGIRYFESPSLHGGMVRPDKVKVGNYPERDPFEEAEI